MRPWRRGLASVSALAALSAPATAQAGPDPVNQPLVDGCQRNPAGLLTFMSPEWVFVNGQAAGDPVHQIQGSATLVHTADEDLPEGHNSYDMDFDVAPDAPYTGLLAGDPSANGGKGNGNFARDQDFAKLHVEWESGSVPTFVWPAEHDRIALWGQWIWDCGHWGQGIQTPTSQQDFQGSLQNTGDYFLPGQIEGPPPPTLRGEQTELHPMQALVVTRAASWSSPQAATETDAFISSDGTHAYAEEQCASGRASAAGPGQPGAPSPIPGLATYGPDFAACVNNTANDLQPIAGRSYSFHIPAPPRPSADAQLTLREQQMVTGRGFTEQVASAGDGVDVTVTANPPADGSPHAFGQRYYVGWAHPSGSSAGVAPAHLRLTVKSITVNNALAEPNPVHPTAAGPPGVGRYNLYLNANGYWNFMGGRAPEPDTSWAPGLGFVHDGQSFDVNQTVDLFVPAGAPVRLDVSGRECDLPRMDPCAATAELADANDHPGEAVASFASADAALGDHTLLSPNHDPPQSNPGADPSTVPPDYQVAYSIRRVVGPSGGPTGTPNPEGLCAASPPGSTGVGSSSPGGKLGGSSSVLGCAAGAGGAGCAGRPPASRIFRGQLSRRRRLHLRGTARPGRCGRITQVRVAVARVVRGRCRFVNRRGRMRRTTGCAHPQFLRARGRSRWSLSLRGRFPRGRYVAFSQAIDGQGRVELRRLRGNRARFRVP